MSAHHVNGCIAAAIRGDFGNVQFTTRTHGSELFVNPLMALYFGFDLPGVAARSLYLPQLEGTETIFEVSARIEAFHHGVAMRARRAIPHMREHTGAVVADERMRDRAPGCEHGGVTR